MSDLGNELCNYLKNEVAKHSRFGETDIHVSDVLNCNIKTYLDRAFDASESCGSLARMKTGGLWENLAETMMEGKGYTHEPHFETDVTIVIRGIKHDRVLTARPDWVKETQVGKNEKEMEIIELKTTQYQFDVVTKMINNQFNFLMVYGKRNSDQDCNPFSVQNLRFQMPSSIPSGYVQGFGKKDLPIYMNSMAQMAAYWFAFSPDYVENLLENEHFEEYNIAKDLYVKGRKVPPRGYSPTKRGAKLKNKLILKNIGVYSDKVMEMQPDWKSIKDYFENYFEPRIERTIKAVFLSTLKFNERVLIDLWLRESSDIGILSYIGCNKETGMCPYFATGICPGMWPAGGAFSKNSVLYIRRRELIGHILKWFQQRKYTIPANIDPDKVKWDITFVESANTLIELRCNVENEVNVKNKLLSKEEFEILHADVIYDLNNWRRSYG